MSEADESGTTRIYLQKSSGAALERRLLSLRVPDVTRILDPESADAIAAEYDGAWGAARMVCASPEAWLVWVKTPKSHWPTEPQIEKIVQAGPRFGWTTFYPDGAKVFLSPAADEPAWRWLLTCQRERGEQSLNMERPDGEKVFISPAADEPVWRWLRTCQRESSEQSLNMEHQILARWWAAIQTPYLALLSAIGLRKRRSPLREL
jgi:hypothetical protein